MIIGSDMKLDVGQRVDGLLSDRTGKLHDIPFMVLRVSNRAEYVEWCKVNKCEPTLIPGLGYYQVSVD